MSTAAAGSRAPGGSLASVTRRTTVVIAASLAAPSVIALGAGCSPGTTPNCLDASMACNLYEGGIDVILPEAGPDSSTPDSSVPDSSTDSSVHDSGPADAPSHDAHEG